MNEIFTQSHQPIISWKGQTLSQITSSITKNNPTMGDNKKLFLYGCCYEVNEKI